MTNMRLRTGLWSLPVTALLACHGDGGIYDNTSRLTSSMLTARAGAPSACALDSLACTPTNISGRIFAGGAMLGDLGSEAYNCTMLAADENILQDPSHGMGGQTEFDLVASELYSGKVSLPDEKDMPSNPIISRIELSFDYVDVSFLIGEGLLAGEYTVRIVLVTETTAPGVDGPLYRGDKLIRSGAETNFRWCNAQQCSLVRSDVESGLLVDALSANYVFPGEGNPNYVSYAVELKNTITVTHEQLADPGNVWNVDFDLGGAVAWLVEPNTFTNQIDLLAAFTLSYAPTQDAGGGPSDDRISATLSIAPL